MNKLAYILELIWLGLSIFCFGIGFWVSYKSGFAMSYMFFVLAAVALLMYLFRRNRRKKMESQK